MSTIDIVLDISISISISIRVDDDYDDDNVEDDDDSTFLTRFLLDLLGGFLLFLDGFVGLTVGTDDRTLCGGEDGPDDTKFVVGAVIMIMVTMVTMVTMMAMMMMLLGYYRY